MSSKKKKDRRKVVFPVQPDYIHLTKPTEVSIDAAQKRLSAFLTRSESRPYMHPESFLATTGIRFAIGLGPKGGPAIHNIRRVEAGLRGEKLAKETPEQIEALFGDHWRNTGQEWMLTNLYEQDAIDKGLQPPKKKQRKSKDEDVQDWVDSSDAQEKMNREYWEKHPAFESGVTTPDHDPDYDWAPGQQEFERMQEEVYGKDEGEGGGVGTYVGADGPPPEMVVHDDAGNEVYTPQQTKEERKAAKKARKEQQKKEKILEAENRERERLKQKEKEAEEVTQEATGNVIKTERGEESGEDEEERERRRAEKRAKREEKKIKKQETIEDVNNAVVEEDRQKKKKKKRKSKDDRSPNAT